MPARRAVPLGGVLVSQAYYVARHTTELSYPLRSSAVKTALRWEDGVLPWGVLRVGFKSDRRQRTSGQKANFTSTPEGVSGQVKVGAAGLAKKRRRHRGWGRPLVRPFSLFVRRQRSLGNLLLGRYKLLSF